MELANPIAYRDANVYRLGAGIRAHSCTKRIAKRLLLVLGTEARHAKLLEVYGYESGVAWNRVL